MFVSDKFVKEKFGCDKVIGEIDMDKFNVMGSLIVYGYFFVVIGICMIM